VKPTKEPKESFRLVKGERRRETKRPLSEGAPSKERSWGAKKTLHRNEEEGKRQKKVGSDSLGFRKKK